MTSSISGAVRYASGSSLNDSYDAGSTPLHRAGLSLTAILSITGNSNPNFRYAYSRSISLVPGAWQPNWFAGNAISPNPSAWYFSYNDRRAG